MSEQMDGPLEIVNRRIFVRIHGIVQGVGFRPHVYQLAHHHRLGGWVRNESNGVEIEASGGGDRIERFIEDITAKAPPLARIVRMEVSERPYAPLDPFAIVPSRSGLTRSALISPDVCTCRDCLDELFDPSNRRHRYPFINCTNCGPRYTIIKDIPYDRDKTTMAPFAMCESCRAEYDDPMNRRFHAQPNACWKCGPRVWLEAPGGREVCEKDEAIRQSIRHLDAGAILAVKGLGGFHLAVLATDESAVSRLRGRKIREEKPFAVMFADLDEVKRTCRVSPEEEILLGSAQRPIVLLERHSDEASSGIAPSVAPRNRFLGAFLPYTPLHYLLFDTSPYKALVMTSGNQSDEPIAADNEEARERLREIADYFLLHDRDIYLRCDDSVSRVIRRTPRFIRRARGYVPTPVFLKEPVPSVLGVGAELKSTVCFTRGDEAFLSQHVGDLENLESLRSFELTIAHLERILEIRPQCIVHDLHPDYLSTRWAEGQTGVERLAVQHHHAHIAAVMAERKLSGPVLGLALDGTGYGPDGTVWGGEILRVDEDGFERLGHFRQVPLPGGDKAVKEPWRMAVSYLWSLYPNDIERVCRELLKGADPNKTGIIVRMLERRVNAPLTSSCGRLFDAVSSLAGLRDSVTYEGQAAIELEQAIEPEDGQYEGEVRREQGSWIVDPFPMVAELVEDVRKSRSPGVIAARFHNGMISLLAAAARKVSAETAINRIALSGGVFQNAYLLQRLEERLAAMGLQVYSHVEVPPNDACIALGQAHIGAQRVRLKTVGAEQGLKP
jgi:hydrogenase maturation protein HypF